MSGTLGSSANGERARERRGDVGAGNPDHNRQALQVVLRKLALPPIPPYLPPNGRTVQMGH